VSKPFFKTTAAVSSGKAKATRNLAKPNRRLPVHGRQQDQITRLGQHNIEEGGDSKGLLGPRPRRGKCGYERAVERADRAIARSDGRIYERNFKVITGVDGEVEVLVR
jgi:hypothetical protein